MSCFCVWHVTSLSSSQHLADSTTCGSLKCWEVAGTLYLPYGFTWVSLFCFLYPFYSAHSKHLFRVFESDDHWAFWGFFFFHWKNAFVFAHSFLSKVPLCLAMELMLSVVYTLNAFFSINECHQVIEWYSTLISQSKYAYLWIWERLIVIHLCTKWDVFLSWSECIV